MTNSRLSNDENKNTNWADILFLEHPQYFLPVLESLIEEAKLEVDGLIKVLEEFNILPGDKIFDYSCGIGRHMIELTKRDYLVFGNNPSDFYIKRAIESADKELGDKKDKAVFYTGFINDLSKTVFSKNKFDFKAIIIMFNSLGFTNEEEDIRTLRHLYEIANPGCILIIQSENRDWTVMNTPNQYINNFDKMLINEIWKFDPVTSIAHSNSKFYEKDSNNDCIHLRLDLDIYLRMYSLHELIALLRKSGWCFVKGYKDIKSLDSVSTYSQLMITISKKKSD